MLDLMFLIITIGFKPYFIWLAPYTKEYIDKNVRWRNCFKPYFIWLAPYTLFRREVAVPHFHSF